jgi:hypothetical protein
MLHRVMMLTAGLLGAAWLAPAEGVAQDKPAVRYLVLEESFLQCGATRGSKRSHH